MKEYKIKTNGRNKEILAKAKELGYCVSPTLSFSNPKYFYFSRNGDVRYGDYAEIFETDEKPEISVDDFLRLGEKPDAYVIYMHSGRTVYLKTRQGDVTESIYRLYQYNLMSKEEYKAKYPDKLQLKGHDVEFISDNFVKIGTVTFHRYILEMLFHNINTAGNDPCEFNNITLEDLFHFISENKEKFGL